MAQTVNITSTGAYTHTLPTRGTITSVDADMAGAAGATGTASTGAAGAGGKGGRIQGTFSATAGDTISGNNGSAGSGTTGGANGGGAGGASTAAAGGGGGAWTSLLHGATLLATAGGGGGGGAGGNSITTTGGKGGDGGGTTAQAGSAAAGVGAGNPGGAGTPSINGAGGTGTAGVDGTAGSGTAGGAGGADGSAPSNRGGGGGGGGSKGGGGGECGFLSTSRGASGGGGGGASSTDAAVTGITHTQGFQSGNGYVTLVYTVLVSYTGTGAAAATGSGSYVRVTSRSYTGTGAAAGTGSGSYTHVPLHPYTGTGTSSPTGSGAYTLFAEHAYTGSGITAAIGAGVFVVTHHYTGSGISTGLGIAVVFGFTPTAVLGVYMPNHDRTMILEISQSDALDEDQDWVNVSPYLLGSAGSVGGSLTYKLGIDPDTGEFSPGTLTLWVDNTDGAFDTHNAASPILECLQARRQIRLRSHRGLPGEIVKDLYDDTYEDVYEGIGRAVIDADVTTHFRGFVNRWPRSYGIDNTFSWVQLAATDGSLILQQSSISDAFFTLDDEVFGLLDGEGLLAISESASDDDANPATHRLSGELVTLVLDAAGWPQDLRTIDAGFVVVGEGNATGSSLQSLTDVADAEQGHFFFWGDGRAAFYDRLSEWTKPRSATVQAHFGGPGGLLFTDIDGIGPDDRQIASTWRRTGLSGIEQTRQSDDARRRWGRITDGPRTVSTVRDTDVAAQLDYLEARHGARTEQIDEIVVSGILTNPGTGEPITGVLVGLLPFDRVAIDFTPPGLDPYPVYEGMALQIETTVTDADWQTTLRLAPAATEVLFALDDSLLDGLAVSAP